PCWMCAGLLPRGAVWRCWGRCSNLAVRPSRYTAKSVTPSRVAGLMCSLEYAALPATWSMRPCVRACRAPRTFLRTRKRLEIFCGVWPVRATPSYSMAHAVSRWKRRWKVCWRAERRSQTSHAVLPALSAALPRRPPVPGLRICHLPHRLRQPHGAVPLHHTGALAYRQAARLPDRTAHPRRRAAIAPEESRHADDGRRADYHFGGDSHAVMGRPARFLHLGSAAWPDWLWMHCLLRRLFESYA